MSKRKAKKRMALRHFGGGARSSGRAESYRDLWTILGAQEPCVVLSKAFRVANEMNVSETTRTVTLPAADSGIAIIAIVANLLLIRVTFRLASLMAHNPKQWVELIACAILVAYVALAVNKTLGTVAWRIRGYAANLRWKRAGYLGASPKIEYAGSIRGKDLMALALWPQAATILFFVVSLFSPEFVALPLVIAAYASSVTLWHDARLYSYGKSNVDKDVNVRIP